MIRALPVLARLTVPVLVAAAAAACTPVVDSQPEFPVTERTLVEAIPADARCRAIGTRTRQGAQPAPFTIDPRRLGFPVEIVCESPGYSPTSETLYPRPQPSLVEGLAAGVLIGRGISVAGGASAPLPFSQPVRPSPNDREGGDNPPADAPGVAPDPSQVQLKLSPTADPAPAAGAPATSIVPFRILVKLRRPFFETQRERDAFYDTIKAERLALWTDIRRRAEVSCQNPDIPRAGQSATSPPALCQWAYRQIDQQRAADLRRVEIDRRRSTFR